MKFIKEIFAFILNLVIYVFGSKKNREKIEKTAHQKAQEPGLMQKIINHYRQPVIKKPHNCRKQTRGRKMQQIELSNGKTKFIRH